MSITSHSPIIILDELDTLRANATTGSLTELRGKAHDLDAAFQVMSPSATKTRIHTFLTNLQGCLVGDPDEYTQSGSLSSAMSNFNDTADDLLSLL